MKSKVTVVPSYTPLRNPLSFGDLEVGDYFFFVGMTGMGICRKTSPVGRQNDDGVSYDTHPGSEVTRLDIQIRYCIAP